MVRTKQRYVLCQITHNSGDKFRVCGLMQNEIRNAIRSQIEEMYGVYGMAICKDALVKYYHPQTGTIIFRFLPKGQKVFGGALPHVKLPGGYEINMIQIAGTIRSVNKKLITMFKTDIMRSEKLFKDVQKLEEKKLGW